MTEKVKKQTLGYEYCEVINQNVVQTTPLFTLYFPLFAELDPRPRAKLNGGMAMPAFALFSTLQAQKKKLVFVPRLRGHA
jgi:hypothetical protein